MARVVIGGLCNWRVINRTNYKDECLELCKEGGPPWFEIGYDQTRRAVS